MNKLKHRLESWAFRTLNIAGRIILLKSILQAIPIYPLSVMAIPKGICSKIKEIFQKFLWGGPKQEKKWALVSWKEISKHKEEGGLGIRDPEILNQVLGAKLWWRWMRGGNDIWKQIWTQKYSMPKKTKDILRVTETPKGSSIWNLASQNREIINKYAFREIRNGSIGQFWEEAWQQRDRLGDIQTIQSTYLKAITKGLKRVKDYWKEEEIAEFWRTWRKPEEWDETIDEEQKENLIKELEKRKIKKSTRPDILRWGKPTKVTFTFKEAYNLAMQREEEEESKEWKQLWKSKWWPKVIIFVWLVAKKRIVTWDKLQKKGYQGPSRCSLCRQEEETQEHLLNSCSYAQYQWE